MARVKGGYVAHRHHKKVLKLSRGYFGSKHRIYKTANEQVLKSRAYAYRDRRNKKRDFRKLWITRVNAACNLNGISYSKFMYGLKIEGIEINRKMLSELAIHDEKAFADLVETSKKAIASAKKPQPKVAEEKPLKVKVSEKENGALEIAIEPLKKKKAPAKKTVVKTEKPVEKKPVEKKPVEKKAPVKKAPVEKSPTPKAEKKPSAKKPENK